MEDLPKKFLDIAPGKIATSTPESNIVNTTSLFSDDENDDADLFGNSKKQSHQPANAPSNTTQESSKKVRRDNFLYFIFYIWRMFNQNVCSCECILLLI